MTLDDGVLVSRRWLERVNQALFGHSQIAHEYNDSTSLFYDVRPAVLASAWSQNAAGVYQATAQFIVNDAVDSSFTFPVVAPTATDDPGGDVGTTRFFVIWRGRWEMIAGAGGGAGIRLCRQINTTWNQDSSGYFYTAVKFLDQYGADTSDSGTVYAPVNYSIAPSTRNDSRYYAVWRVDRWEMIPRMANLYVSVSNNVLYLNIN